MIAALGYCKGTFNPASPGRLCRGRERWIEPFPIDEAPALHRLVVSGARFSDDSAADAERGLPFSGVTPGEVLYAALPGRLLLASAEDADPRAVPEGAVGVEFYRTRLPAGPLERWRARWLLPCARPAEVDAALDAGADVVLGLDESPDAPPEWLVRAAGQPPRNPELEDAPDDPVPRDLREALFLLTGFRQEGAPARTFQPAAIPDVLALVPALALLHRDKHGPCLGIYTREPLDADGALQVLARGRGALPVPFAIPPMLARWDRALWELRQDWDEARWGTFPVPPTTGPLPAWRRHARPAEE